MALVAFTFGVLTLTVCGDDDNSGSSGGGGGGGGNSGSSSGYIDDDSSSSGGESSNSDAYDLYGTWAGVSGSSIITKLVFASGGRGYIKMNSTTAPYAHNGQFNYTFDSSKGHINIVFNDDGTISLYKDAACQNLVGTASSNTYSSWGGYSVSNYSYIVKTSTSTTWVYYFFN